MRRGPDPAAPARLLGRRDPRDARHHSADAAGAVSHAIGSRKGGVVWQVLGAGKSQSPGMDRKLTLRQMYGS